MAYENKCMYCFEDLGGRDICPHCGHDSRAAVPQIQLLPGTLLHNGRFLVGRAMGRTPAASSTWPTTPSARPRCASANTCRATAPAA